MNIKRGDVVITNLEPVVGSEQGKTRPCLVIQNDVGNKVSPTTIVAAITSKSEREFPFLVKLKKGEGNLPREGLVQCNQIRTVPMGGRIIKKIGALKPETMRMVNEALKTSLALG